MTNTLRIVLTTPWPSPIGCDLLRLVGLIIPGDAKGHLAKASQRTMANAAQIETYNLIRAEIARLRGPQSHVPLALEQVTPLTDNGGDASFCVNGARVIVNTSGKVVDA